MLAGFESRAYGRLADVVEKVFFCLLLAEGFDDLHGLQALLGHGDDLALLLADLVGCLLDGLLEPCDEEQK